MTSDFKNQIINIAKSTNYLTFVNKTIYLKRSNMAIK